MRKESASWNIRGLFLESPETFRAYFGWQFSLYLQNEGVSRHETFLNFYSLYNISGSEFDEWLFGAEKFSELSRNGPQHVVRDVVNEVSLQYDTVQILWKLSDSLFSEEIFLKINKAKERKDWLDNVDIRRKYNK